MEIFCKDVAATENVGRKLGRLLRSGDVVALTGTLGAGKTCLAAAIAEAQGIPKDEVTSPTFTIMNVYEGELPVYHFDLYRLEREEELEDIGFAEYCGTRGITLIEWADMFPAELPSEYLEVKIVPGQEGRRINMLPHGRRFEKLIEEYGQC